jgi:hypothetical protein
VIALIKPNVSETLSSPYAIYVKVLIFCILGMCVLYTYNTFQVLNIGYHPGRVRPDLKQSDLVAILLTAPNMYMQKRDPRIQCIHD